MAFITITNIPFVPTPSGNQTVTISHKLASDPDVPGSYTIDVSNLVVAPNGVILSGPYVINGLFPGVLYTVRIYNNCNQVVSKKDVYPNNATTTTTTSTSTTSTSTSSTTTTTTTLASTTTTTSSSTSTTSSSTTSTTSSSTSSTTTSTTTAGTTTTTTSSSTTSSTSSTSTSTSSTTTSTTTLGTTTTTTSTSSSTTSSTSSTSTSTSSSTTTTSTTSGTTTTTSTTTSTTSSSTSSTTTSTTTNAGTTTTTTSTSTSSTSTTSTSTTSTTSSSTTTTSTTLGTTTTTTTTSTSTTSTSTTSSSTTTTTSTPCAPVTSFNDCYLIDNNGDRVVDNNGDAILVDCEPDSIVHFYYEALGGSGGTARVYNNESSSTPADLNAPTQVFNSGEYSTFYTNPGQFFSFRNYSTGGNWHILRIVNLTTGEVVFSYEGNSDLTTAGFAPLVGNEYQAYLVVNTTGAAFNSPANYEFTRNSGFVVFSVGTAEPPNVPTNSPYGTASFNSSASGTLNIPSNHKLSSQAFDLSSMYGYVKVEDLITGVVMVLKNGSPVTYTFYAHPGHTIKITQIFPSI